MKRIKSQGQRQRNFPFQCLKRRKLAQREQVICLRTHESKWFQSTLHRITVPLLRILASLQVRFYPKTAPHLLILLPSVGPAVFRYHSHSGFSGWRCCIVSPSVFVTLLFISTVKKGPLVSKKPDETNNITWPKWRHFFYHRRMKYSSFNWPETWQHVLWISLCTIWIVGSQWNQVQNSNYCLIFT